MASSGLAARAKRLSSGAIFGLAILLAVTSAEFLNFTGFCWADLRYYSDRELINAAIGYELRMNEAADYVKDRKRYQSLEEFLAVNRDCCRVYRWGHPLELDGVWVRVFGWYIAVVNILYRLRDDGPRQFFDRYSFVNACGKVMNRMGSESQIGPSPASSKYFPALARVQ
jgi:hypothetical protein